MATSAAGTRKRPPERIFRIIANHQICLQSNWFNFQIIFFKYVFLNFGRHDKLSFSIGGTWTHQYACNNDPIQKLNHIVLWYWNSFPCKKLAPPGANNKSQSCSLLTEWFVFFLHLSSFEELSSLYLRSEFQLRSDDSERAYNLPSAGRRSRWSLGEFFRSLHRWSPQISLSQRQSSWWFKFLLAGWGSRGSRAGSAEGDAASRAEECRRRAVLLVQKFWYFPTL